MNKHFVHVIPVCGLLIGALFGQTAPQSTFDVRGSNLHPNVILITLDTVRADHIAAYGSRTVATPVVDALAKDGVLFERAISQVPLTWPSHADKKY